MREGGIEREIQHEAKPSAVFDSRGPPSAIISVVYERKRYINWFVVGSMAAACRRMAVDPKLLSKSTTICHWILILILELAIGSEVRARKTKKTLVVLSRQTFFQKSESFRLVSKRSVSL